MSIFFLYVLSILSIWPCTLIAYKIRGVFKLLFSFGDLNLRRQVLTSVEFEPMRTMDDEICVVVIF